MKKIFSFILILFSMFFIVSCDNDSSDKVKVIDVALTSEDYAYVVKKGNVDLVNDFNSFLNEIKEDGTLDEIVNKYFETNSEKIGVEYITSQNTINDEKTFIVATNCPFEPFEYIENGLIYGIDIEIARLYAIKNNLNLVVKNIDFDSIFTSVDSSYADIGMAGITITDERLALYDFTNPYFTSSQRLIVSTDNETFNNCSNVDEVESIIKNLNNEKIGYQIGTTGNWYITGDETFGFKGFSNVNPVGYKSAQLAVEDVINGQIYGVIVDEAPAKFIVNAMNDVSSFDGKWSVFISSISQKNFQQLILKGLLNTLLIAVFGLLIGIVIGTLIAIVKVSPKYKKVIRVLDKVCDVYIAIFRGTPIVVQLLLAYYVILPLLSIKGVSPLLVGIIVFGMNSGAYVAEIMRGGINSVDKGQLEAGRALGISYSKTMVKIIIPQAIKNILPTLGNEFISLIKETSVVSFITIIDLYTAFNTIGSNTYSVVFPYIFMAIIYVILFVLISLLIKVIERRFAKSDRNN